jgi:hypothetical protein
MSGSHSSSSSVSNVVALRRSRARRLREPFISSRDAAPLLGLKPPGLVLAAREGRVPAYVFGDGRRPRYMFKKSELLALIRRVQPRKAKRS